MNELAIALTLRGMCKSDSILFNNPDGVLPERSSRPFQVGASEQQGQAWFYVYDQQGNRHRIIVEEA